MRQQLEMMTNSYRLRSSEPTQQVYFVARDLERLSASALYGDMDRKYDFKDLGFQLSIHEDSKKGITGTNIKQYGEQHGVKINHERALMGEFYAQNLGIQRIDTGSKS